MVMKMFDEKEDILGRSRLDRIQHSRTLKSDLRVELLQFL